MDYKMTRAEAVAAGYTIDDCCNPPFAYKGPRFGNCEGFSVPSEEVEELRAELEEERQCNMDLSASITCIGAELEAWKTAILDELVTLCIYSADHDTNPRKAVKDAIAYHCQIALDPLVSSEAQALIDRGRAEMRAELPVQPSDVRTVRVGAQGVQFGNAWCSHESITGYDADQLNSGACGVFGRAYMKWLAGTKEKP